MQRAKKLVRPELCHWPAWDPLEKAVQGWDRISQPRVPTRVGSAPELCAQWDHPALWVPDQTHWNLNDWSLNQLTQEYHSELFALGCDDQDQDVLVELHQYRDYCAANHDKNPLYLFDSTVDQLPGFNDRFRVPQVFVEQDLLLHLAPDERPDCQWLLVGPERAGSGWHKDPVGAAWNALMVGQKRWVMTPPGVELESNDDVVTWFGSIWPELKRQCDTWFEFVQSPGELVYIPVGWGHAVINTKLSVAITQNFVATRDAAQSTKPLENTHPELAIKIMRCYDDVVNKFNR